MPRRPTRRLYQHEVGGDVPFADRIAEEEIEPERHVLCHSVIRVPGRLVAYVEVTGEEVIHADTAARRAGQTRGVVLQPGQIAPELRVSKTKSTCHS